MAEMPDTLLLPPAAADRGTQDAAATETGAEVPPHSMSQGTTGNMPCLLVYSAGPALERSRPLLRRLEDAGARVLLRTDEDLAGEEPVAPPGCDALLVLWSQFFHGAYESRLTDIAKQILSSGGIVLNDVPHLVEMQDRRWLLRQMKELGVPAPEYVECSRDGGNDPSLQEHDDYIEVAGQRIHKPFVEKPIDRRDRAIYVYFPKVAGGGRALVSTSESGDTQYVCRFEMAGRVRREGSFVYQEYLQSEGFVVQAVCVGDLVYGNAVLSGVVNQTSTATGPSADRNGQPCAVWLRQEEKLIACKLREVFKQTLFGLTFVRSQTASGSARSYVIDVWPGIPISGLGTHRDDVVRALLSDIGRRLPDGIVRMRSLHLESPVLRPSSSPMLGSRTLIGPLQSQYVPHDASAIPGAGVDAGAVCTDPDVELLCVLLVARHGDRTPKQKVKAKAVLSSEFAAGWLCGWLADANAVPLAEAATPMTFELRKPDQLSRLASAFQQLQAGGHEVGTLVDALRFITKEGLACHAKVGADGATIQVTLKWGGELTLTGVDEAEALGWCFRGKTYPGEDIDELHATLRHDIKIYASKEPRCQQTAAAFGKGLLHLDLPLPPIIAALVRTDDFRRPDEDQGKSSVEKPGDALLPVDASWEELEAVAGVHATPSLRAYATPSAALQALGQCVELLRGSLQEGCGALHRGESHALLLERYRDLLAELGAAAGQLLRMDKAPHVLDNLQYDARHNRAALPDVAARSLDEAVLLAEALCDVVVPLQAALDCKAAPGGRSAGVLAGRSILSKLRWDLRVASGADLGDETAHLGRHEALYALSADGTVRTRLYFGHNSWLQGLLSALCSGPATEPPATGHACRGLLQIRLGFLAHFTMQLRRQRSTGELRVSGDFAPSAGEEPRCLFDLPLADVDAWWSEVLEA